MGKNRANHPTRIQFLLLTPCLFTFTVLKRGGKERRFKQQMSEVKRVEVVIAETESGLRWGEGWREENDEKRWRNDLSK